MKMMKCIGNSVSKRWFSIFFTFMNLDIFLLKVDLVLCVSCNMQLSKFEVEWQPERCLPDLERNLTFNIFNTFTDINFSYIYINIYTYKQNVKM